MQAPFKNLLLLLLQKKMIFGKRIIISVGFGETAVGEGIGEAVCKYGNINVKERTLVPFQLKCVH